MVLPEVQADGDEVKERRCGMTFFEFLYTLSRSGTFGAILAVIILLAIYAFCGSVIFLPFRISAICNDVREIKDMLKKRSGG